VSLSLEGGENTVKLREALERDVVFAPSCYDPLTARLAEQAGFPAVALGGYALGAHLATSEPLLGLEEVCRITRYVTAAVKIPVIVDGGAGWGDALHTMRTVRELEKAGASAIHIEDQVFPKRTHYHRGVEHVVPLDQILAKLEWAVKARSAEDFLLIGRTDALRTDGYDEAVRRARAFLDVGCDMVMVFPENARQAEDIVRDIGGPTVYVNSAANRFGRPVLDIDQLRRMGYKMCIDSSTVICAAFEAVSGALAKMTSKVKSPLAERIGVRDRLEEALGLGAMYAIEERTVEK
jgi:methylisocitrate lyase